VSSYPILKITNFKKIMRNTLIQVLVLTGNNVGVRVTSSLAIETYYAYSTTNKTIDTFTGTHTYNIALAAIFNSLTITLTNAEAGATDTWQLDWKPSADLTPPGAGDFNSFKVKFSSRDFSYDGTVVCLTSALGDTSGSPDGASTCSYDTDLGITTISLDVSKTYDSTTPSSRVMLQSSGSGIVNPALPG